MTALRADLPVSTARWAVGGDRRAGAQPADLRLLPPAAAVWATTLVALRIGDPAPILRTAGVTALVGVVLLVAAARRPPACRPPAAGAAAGAGHRPAAVVAAGGLLCAAAAAASSGLHCAAVRQGPLPRLAVARAYVTLDVVLTGDPVRRAAAGAGTASASRGVAVLFPARATAVQGKNVRARIRSPVLVLARGQQWLGLLPSQRVQVRGALLAPRAGELLSAVMVARGGAPRAVRPPSDAQRIAGRVRAGLRGAAAGLPVEEAGLLPGLVVGDTSALPAGLRADFRTAGMTHLVAVSGENLAILLGAVLVLTRSARLGPRAGPLVGGIALLGFVVLVRPSPSVLRAAVMGGAVVLAMLTGRRTAPLPALSAAVLLLLLIDPGLSQSAGFALSVSATLGLVVIAPGWRAAMARRMPGWLADLLAISAAAQFACAPVLAMIGGSVSLVAVPANLLAAPAVAPATITGMLAAVTAPFAPPVARGLAWLAVVPTGWLAGIAHLGAGTPGASLAWPDGAVGGLELAVAMAGLWWAVRRRALGRAHARSVGSTPTAAATVAAPHSASPPGSNLTAVPLRPAGGDMLVRCRPPPR